MHSQSEPPNLAAIKTPISQEAFDQLFREARTHSTWLPEPVPVELLREAYELARLGPTSANGSPARFVFPTTSVAKALLKPFPAALPRFARQSTYVSHVLRSRLACSTNASA